MQEHESSELDGRSLVWGSPRKEKKSWSASADSARSPVCSQSTPASTNLGRRREGAILVCAYHGRPSVAQTSRWYVVSVWYIVLPPKGRLWCEEWYSAVAPVELQHQYTERVEAPGLFYTQWCVRQSRSISWKGGRASSNLDRDKK